MADPDMDDVERRMRGAVEALKREFGGLRTGRASVSLLEPLVVEAYGASMPINQIGTIGAPEARLLTVQVWDRTNVRAVERAILESGLGLNPSVDGQLVRVPIPELSEERRAELAKVAHRYAEGARVAVRNVRRDGMDTLRRMEKEGELSQDDHRLWAAEIQDLTDRYVGEVDSTASAKESEIMQV